VILVDSVWGSRGTKGNGWTQSGIIVDFIGQRTRPSTNHLLALDALIALAQFLTITISFSITLPSDLDASTANGETETNGELTTGGEAARDYFGLLGLHERSVVEEEGDGIEGFGYEDFELEEEERRIEQVARRKRRRSGNAYEEVGNQDEDNVFDDDDDLEMNDYGTSFLKALRRRIKENHAQSISFVLRNETYLSASTSTSKLPSSLSTSSRTNTRERIVIAPIAKLRFRHVWNEVKWNSRRAKEDREVFDLTREEEGIGIGGASSTRTGTGGGVI